jgi:hypothetical protein
VGKKFSGIKRHIAVDTQGRPHAVAVTTAAKRPPWPGEQRRLTLTEVWIRYSPGLGFNVIATLALNAREG